MLQVQEKSMHAQQLQVADGLNMPLFTNAACQQLCGSDVSALEPCQQQAAFWPVSTGPGQTADGPAQSADGPGQPAEGPG